MIRYPYEIINVEKKYELPNNLVDEHNRYVELKLTDYETMQQPERNELNDLSELLYPYNISSGDWNKFQEITANLQKFITIDMVKYINESYFTMDDVRNEIDIKIDIFKTGELIKIIKDEVKKMGNFYTYIRPSETEYISFPNVRIDMANFFKSSGLGFSGELLFQEFYDNNLFGFACFEATVTFNPNIRWYSRDGANPFFGGNVGGAQKFSYPTLNVDVTYPHFNENNSLEVPPQTPIYLNFKQEKNYQTGAINPPSTHINFSSNLGSNGADIYMNQSFSYKIKSLLTFSNASDINISFVGSSPFYFHSGSGTSDIGYDMQGEILISDIRIYREKFTPPINVLGDLG